jgi:hypothetical protein
LHTSAIANLENDPDRGSGWALLRVELPAGSGGALAAAGEGAKFSFSVRDAQSGEWLQKFRAKRQWSRNEHFFEADRLPSARGELVLSVPPTVTERMVENLFFFSVKAAGLTFPGLMVQAGHILTASTPILLTPPPDDLEDEEGSGTEEGLCDFGEGVESEDGYELPGPEECLNASGAAVVGAGSERVAPVPAGPLASGRREAVREAVSEAGADAEGQGGGHGTDSRPTGEDRHAPSPVTETESYGVPARLLGDGREDIPYGAADEGPGPFFPDEDEEDGVGGKGSAPGDPAADRGSSETDGGSGRDDGDKADGDKADGEDGENAAVAGTATDVGQGGRGRRAFRPRRWLALAALLLIVPLLYLALWQGASKPLEPSPPQDISPPLPDPPPVAESVPLEGCWAADGLTGAAPGDVRRPVRVQYCFLSPEAARLTVFDLAEGGVEADVCTSGAAVSGSGQGTLIAGDPEGPVCSRAPDTSYVAMSLSCSPRPGGDVGCLIETEGGEPPLEAVFTRRS